MIKRYLEINGKLSKLSKCKMFFVIKRHKLVLNRKSESYSDPILFTRSKRFYSVTFKKSKRKITFHFVKHCQLLSCGLYTNINGIHGILY